MQCKTSSEHSGHNVQPIKTFLSKLEVSLKRIELERTSKTELDNTDNQGGGERNLLDKLEEHHLEMLSLLKIQIEEIAERVRVC